MGCSRLVGGKSFKRKKKIKNGWGVGEKMKFQINKQRSRGKKTGKGAGRK